METQISQYGNSLAVRIPKPFAKDLGITKGSPVKVYVRDSKIIVEILKRPTKKVGTPPSHLMKFVGRLPRENFDELERIIRDGCERVDDENW